MENNNNLPELIECKNCPFWDRSTAEHWGNVNFHWCTALCRFPWGEARRTEEHDRCYLGIKRKEETSNGDPFKPGDKFILEIGEKREFLDEYNIAGTDLYVRTSLLKKLPKMNPLKSEEDREDERPY